MKICCICGNKIEDGSVLCPVCGASQEPELPQYGAGMSQQVMQPVRHDAAGMAPYGSDVSPERGNLQSDLQSGGKVQPEFQAPEYASRIYEWNVPEKSEVSRRTGRTLIALTAGVGTVLLLCVYFLVLVLTRNSLLNNAEKLRDALPTYSYTINGANYGELELVSMNRRSTEGFFEFEAMYDVTMADDRLEHRMTMYVKGRNTFPFGWQVTNVTWKEKTQGTVAVKLTGIRPLVEAEVLKGIPTHQAENLAIWFRDGDSDSPAFEGDCVIANPRGANYTIQGSYSFEGMLAPSVEFDHGIYDYALTVSRRRLGGASDEDSVSYGINVEKLTAPVYVKEVSDGEYRLQISGISGNRVNIEAFRYYNDGREPEYGGKTGVPLYWDVKEDPMTGNPIASDRVGGGAYLFSVPSEFQVILGPDTVEVLWNEDPMLPRKDVRLAPEGWAQDFPEDVETIDG